MKSSFYFRHYIETIPPANSRGIQIPPHYLKPGREDIPQQAVDLTEVRRALANLDALVEKYPELTDPGGGQWVDALEELDQLTRDQADSMSQSERNTDEKTKT